MQLLRRGDIGPTVVEVRAMLTTFALMISAPMTGDDVVMLQERLSELGYNPGRPGGVFDEQTERALRRFQREYGLVSDGLCGPATLRSLKQLGRKVTGGRPHLMREQELLRQAGPRLRGKRIVVDPGHGGVDRGIVASGVAEADLMWDLARRLVGRMTATGMDAMLSRQEDTCPTDPERAAFANTAGADLVLSLHTDANLSMHAQGLATFHFGNGTGSTSTVGEALAGLIQRELLTRTAMVDCWSQARTWELLRLTRMPAVRIEVGYLSHIGDRTRLMDRGHSRGRQAALPARSGRSTDRNVHFRRCTGPRARTGQRAGDVTRVLCKARSGPLRAP